MPETKETLKELNEKYLKLVHTQQWEKANEILDEMAALQREPQPVSA